MSCCGNKRNSFKTHNNSNEVSRTHANRTTYTISSPTFEHSIVLQYTGNTSLEARGVFSRRLYRFNKPGAMLEVDRRDSPSLLALGQLKPITVGNNFAQTGRNNAKRK